MPPHSNWTFLSNHGHVMICLSQDPDRPLREVAIEIGITERAVQRIVADLEEAGYLDRRKEGRRNHYVIHDEVPLRHRLEAHRSIGDLLHCIGQARIEAAEPE
ncbi:MAG: helix-turn-helix transcriptional regulator [Opitutales bacterium]